VADVRAKALGYLRDQKLHVLYARTPADARSPVAVIAVVEAHTAVRRVELRDGTWTCDCKTVLDDGLPCAHLAAVQLVTNHPSAAAKPVKDVAA
jgi:hypothetical protein